MWKMLHQGFGQMSEHAGNMKLGLLGPFPKTYIVGQNAELTCVIISE